MYAPAAVGWRRFNQISTPLQASALRTYHHHLTWFNTCFTAIRHRCRSGTCRRHADLIEERSPAAVTSITRPRRCAAGPGVPAHHYWRLATTRHRRRRAFRCFPTHPAPDALPREYMQRTAAGAPWEEHALPGPLRVHDERARLEGFRGGAVRRCAGLLITAVEQPCGKWSSVDNVTMSALRLRSAGWRFLNDLVNYSCRRAGQPKGETMD